MDDTVTLTVAIDGTFYFGYVAQWRHYAQELTKGRVGAYRRSPAFGNQSLKNFFEMMRRTWKKSTPLPAPEECGLVPLQPESCTQFTLINELLREAA